MYIKSIVKLITLGLLKHKAYLAFIQLGIQDSVGISIKNIKVLRVYLVSNRVRYYPSDPMDKEPSDV